MKFYYLQLLRFVAASAVVFFHTLHTGITFVDFFIGKGDYAVSLFFILSGFVIANSLIAKPLSFTNYFKRRATKIYPQWLLSIFLNVVISGTIGISLLRVLLSLLLLQSVYPPFALDMNFVGWSLCVEILMYIVMYLIIRYTNIRSKWYDVFTWSIWLITQFVFLYLLRQHTTSTTADQNWENFLVYNPVWHLNVFLLGILFCKYLPAAHSFKFISFRYASIVFTIGYVFIVFSLFAIGYKLGIPRFYHNGFLAPLSGLYILLLSAIEAKHPSNKDKTNKKNRLYDLLGAISFGMYLFHMPIYYLINPLMGVGKSGANFLIYYTIVILFSYFAYLIFDKRLHKLLYKRA